MTCEFKYYGLVFIKNNYEYFFDSDSNDKCNIKDYVSKSPTVRTHVKE